MNERICPVARAQSNFTVVIGGSPFSAEFLDCPVTCPGASEEDRMRLSPLRILSATKIVCNKPVEVTAEVENNTA